MSVFKAVTFSLLSAGILAGCQTSDPEYQVQKAQQRATAQANAMQTVADEFGPLLPLCVQNLSQGTPITQAKMTTLGFSKAMVGYKKPRGSSAMDRINLSNTTFHANGKLCSMGLGNFFGVQQAGAFVRKELVAQGYTAGPKIKAGFPFTKGSTTLYLNGYSYSTVTTVSLSK